MIRHNLRKVVTTALPSDYAYDITAVDNTIQGKSQDIDDKVVFLTFDDGIDQH